MYALKKLAENINNTDIGKVFVLTFKNPNLKSLVISLNHDQLQFGQLSDNSFMPNYSQTSVNVYGKRAGRYTLFDTGQLYKSFKIETVVENAIVETGNLVKEDTDWGEIFDNNVLGLGGKSLEILLDEAIPVMIEVLLEEWKK